MPDQIGPKREKRDYYSGQPKPSGKANPGDVTIKEERLESPVSRIRGNGPTPPKWMDK